MLYEIAYDMPSNRGMASTADMITRNWIPKAQAEGKALYRSTYAFADDLERHFGAGYKSCRGFIGDMRLPFLIFDIDKGKDSDQGVLKRARMFTDRLYDDWKIGEDMMAIYYSGSGYHIMTRDFFGFRSGEKIAEEVRATMFQYFPEVDPSFYMEPGLIRVSGTVNYKTGRYKIPLSYEEFKEMTAEEIMALADRPREMTFDLKHPERMHSNLIIKTEPVKQVSKIAPSAQRIVTCAQKMFQKGEEIGKRHDRMMRMISAWRRAGVPLEGVTAMMKAYAPSMEEYEVEKYVHDVYGKGYAFGCKDRVMMEFCDPKCIYFENKNYAPELLSPVKVDQELKKFAKTDFSQTSFDLGGLLKSGVSHMIYPGWWVNMVGDTGVNKTALAQNILMWLPDMRKIYMSTEFGVMFLHRRFLQIHHSMSKDEVLEHYKGNETSLPLPMNLRYLEVASDIDSIKRLIYLNEPHVVVIDVLNDLPGVGTYSEEEKLAKKLKELVMETKIILITVQHISKHAIEHTTPQGETVRKKLGAHSGKGSSAFEQKADVLMTLEGERDKILRTITVQKGRDDRSFAVPHVCDMRTFRFMHASEYRAMVE